MNNFIKRALSGVVFVGVMLAALLLNKYIFGAVMALSLVVMMKEFLKMTCGKDYWFSQILSILAGTTLFVLVYLYRGFNFPGRLVILAFIPVFLLMVNSLYVKDKTRFDKFSNLYTAVLYIAVPWSLLNFAVFDGCGAFNGVLLLSFFVIIWGSDVGAYIFGITLGQRYGKKLFPSISPKKSWIGFWGGMAMAIALAVGLHYLGMLPFDLPHCIAMSVLLNVTGVYGDLIESQWKRHYDVKDSGTIIPGHGGLLDRFDSALIAIPVGIIYLVAINILFV
jgi:phosphatidate cytidylyltransferase